MSKRLPPRDSKGRFKKRSHGYHKRTQVRRNTIRGRRR